MNYTKSRFELSQARRWQRRQTRSKLESAAKIGTATAAAVALSGLAGKAQASIINVSHIQDVVPAAGTQGGVSRDYETYNLKVDGQEPQALTLAFAYRTVPGIGNVFIGGLENLPGDPFTPITTATGFINKDDANFWGLENYGDVLGGNVPGGFFGFYDKNGDGNIGTFNDVTGVLTPDTGESYPIVTFTGFQAFPEQNVLATVNSINLVPEPATGAFIVAGLVASLLAKRARNFGNRVKQYFK
ncbi:hypothetical protein FJZ19_02985 [Candidatus Pacearchaeota archaeon]|nr:hypothetical protein [Candidatus Pacearchaeota archaeon]